MDSEPEMGHTHAHGHSPEAGRAANKRSLKIVLGITGAYTAAEVIGALITGSLALLADAAHMFSDNLSIALALGALWLAERPPSPERSFGYKRAEILAAFVNGITLVAISLWIFYESWQRFEDPPEIAGAGMLAIALGGLVVNGIGAAILMRSHGESLNVSAALRHVIADLLGSVGVIVAAVVILISGWLYADPLVSAVIGALILASSWGILRDSTRVLLEATPAGIDAAEVGRSMASLPGVVQVHDLHLWEVTSGFPALSAHVLVGADEDCHALRRELDAMLAERFAIDHVTLQVEHAHDGLLQIQNSSQRPNHAVTGSGPAGESPR